MNETAAVLTNSGTLNVNGTFQLNQGGSLAGTNAVYGVSSTLIYAGTSSQTTTNTEFPSSSGALQQVMNVETGNNNLPLDISRLQKGSYTIKVIGQDGSEANGRFVRQ